MNGKDILKAVGETEDRFILESDPDTLKKNRKNNVIIRKVLPLAAAVCLIAVGAAFMAENGFLQKKSADMNAEAAAPTEKQTVKYTETNVSPTEVTMAECEAVRNENPAQADEDANGIEIGCASAVMTKEENLTFEENEESQAEYFETGEVPAGTGTYDAYRISAAAEKTEKNGMPCVCYEITLTAGETEIGSMDFSFEPGILREKDGRICFEEQENLICNASEGTFTPDLSKLLSGEKAVLRLYVYDDEQEITILLHYCVDGIMYEDRFDLTGYRTE